MLGLSSTQIKAINKAALDHGWNELTVHELKILLWALFHYFVLRLPE